MKEDLFVIVYGGRDSDGNLVKHFLGVQKMLEWVDQNCYDAKGMKVIRPHSIFIAECISDKSFEVRDA